MDVSTEPSSLFMIRAAELFPKPVVEKEEDNLEVPLIECECFNAILRNFIILFIKFSMNSSI